MSSLMMERYNLLSQDNPFPASFGLYLSDDARHIYLTYEIHRTLSFDPIPLSELEDYAQKYDTIVHFGKYYEQRYYGSELEGVSYMTYTDGNKVAFLNENYSTRKFSLILFEKPLDSSKPYGGGKILVQKDLPADADAFVFAWWEQNYTSPTAVYDIDEVIDFARTHDRLEGFTTIFRQYSVGMTFADMDQQGNETGFFYQICIGPNDYVIVYENYIDRKLQILRGPGEKVLFERALDPTVTDSDRLPK